MNCAAEYRLLTVRKCP